MKSLAVWVAVLFSSLLIQAVLLPDLFGSGPRPDLLLLVTVAAGLLGGREMGFGIGFFSGLIQDLASGNIFGLNTFSKMFVGYASGIMENKVFKDSFLLPVVSAVLATFFSEFVIAVFLYIFGYQSDSWHFFYSQFLSKAVYNFIIAWPVHQVIYRLFFR